ncbi:MAG: PKD domain-containing protein, partial [Bacteroidota bacterium]|nr:PKD domain-containing protein [Bacteroidota bacterium]
YGCSITLPATIGPVSPITIAELISTNENCLGSGDGNASVTVIGGTAPYTYAWSNGVSGNSIIAPSGTYTVSISDAFGCAPITGQIEIGSTGLPNVANAGGDAVICMNNYPIQLQGSVVNASGGIWSGGSGALNTNGLSAEYYPTINEILAGGVDLFLTTTGNPTCPSATDTIHLTLANAFINAAIVADNANCSGSADGSLSFSPADPSFTYVWNVPGAPAGAIATGLQAGTYSINVIDALGCDSTFTGTIGEPEELVIAAINTIDVTCNAGNNGQVSVVISGGTQPYSANWSNGATTLFVNNLQAGELSVEVTDQSGCSTTAIAVVEQPAPITLQAQIPDTVCVNAPVMMTAQAQGGNGNYQFNWNGLGTGDSLTVGFPASQFVFLSVTDGAGCTAPSIMELVNVLDLSLADFSVYGNTTVCAGQEVTVGATVGGYFGNYIISWPELPGFGTGPFTFALNGSTNMPVILSNSCGDSQNETITLVVNVPPAVELPPIIAQGCAPLTVQMPNIPLGNVSWTWDLGNGQVSNAPSPTVVYQAGTYTVGLTVTSQFGCSSSGSATGQIIAGTSPIAAFTASTYATDLENAIINFTNESTGNITSYNWTFGDGGTSGAINPVHHYFDIGTFQVDLTVQSANGCTASATNVIQITPDYDITVPNAFTPGTNGGNGG